jgi:hypothetical protein
MRQHTKEASSPYSPEVLAKLNERGINPETFTLKQLFPTAVMDTEKVFKQTAEIREYWRLEKRKQRAQVREKRA